ncbi:hypothetical protein [Allorhodopirellula solitaria]|uniref:Secreted protein n=1 Tax=Allorhodopirellula solitaria TaxID=2527987 RepID=A0A5C5YJZ0_9BACT|nr:hypothetical protein [Allorhodopirellula solitaria]TWT75139.1 hypothetical protein CA85_04280 [Allorhodopirellula solitaria]
MTRILFSLAALCLIGSPIVSAGDATASKDSADKGLCAGDKVGAFQVTKIAGGEGDSVKEGSTLCYRCKYGQRPMVMVFTRGTEGSVAKLVRRIDAAVVKHSDDELKGLVTLIGKEPEALTNDAKAMAKKLKNKKNVPIVVAKDAKNGPDSYKLNADTAVTVLLVNHSEVIARHDFAADQIDVPAVMKQVKEMLN